MDSMTKLENMLYDELDKIVQGGELTAGSLDAIDKLTHSIKSIECINGGKYSGGCDYTGRSYGRRMYSRDNDMHSRIRELMDQADDKTRRALQRALDSID